jgi:hypothetical protein
MMAPEIKASDRRLLAGIGLALGILLTIVGWVGIYLQGSLYKGGFPTAATGDEVRYAFTLPTAVTALGCWVVGGTLLSSPLTANWPPRRKLAAFALYGIVMAIGCALSGHWASQVVAPILN